MEEMDKLSDNCWSGSKMISISGPNIHEDKTVQTWINRKHACFERSYYWSLIEVKSINEYCMQTYAVEWARDNCYGPYQFADCVNEEIEKADRRYKYNSGKRNLTDEVTTAFKRSSFYAEFACKLREEQYIIYIVANPKSGVGNDVWYIIQIHEQDLRWPI